MVIVRALPRGIHRPSLAALPEVTSSQERHRRHTANVPDQDIACARRQAQDDRHRRPTATIPGPETVLADVITHPEMLTVAPADPPPARSGHPATGGSRPTRLLLSHPLDPLQNHLSQLPRAKGGIMGINIPRRLRNEDFATCLVKRYLAPDPATGRARYSGAYFERIGGGGDRPEVAYQFTAEDLLAITMLSVRIEGYHALEVLHYQADKLNDLLSQIPDDLALQTPRAAAHIAKGGPAWRLWEAICDIEPRPERNRIGPIAAGKLLARKRPRLLPVYDSRIKKALNRSHTDNKWWHDLHDLLISDPDLIQELEAVRNRAGADHMSLLRVFDVMCWMFSWPSEVSACDQEVPD
jgi:hypothetical protein